MKNENEYCVKDRRYVKTIKCCVCQEKKGDEYILDCTIYQRGEHSYLCRIGEPCLDRNGKKLWLSENAAMTVLREIERFEKELAAFMKVEYEVPLLQNEFTLYYRQNDQNAYDFLLRIAANGRECFKLYRGRGIAELIKEISQIAWTTGLNENVVIRTVERSTEETIRENPIYLHALNIRDECTAKQLLLHYNIATVQDCRDIERLLGVRIMPKLPEEFNCDYAVEAETVDCKLLRDSGYAILHRPCFAMNGCTHGKWMLNPHTKMGVDAAKIDEVALPFPAYLKLVEDALKVYPDL